MISHLAFVLLSIGIVLTVLLVSERGKLRGEYGRKFVHIMLGTFAAFWPYFLDWNEIRLLSLGAVAGFVVSKWLGWFRVARYARRFTYGEVLSALAVGLMTLVTESKGIYATAILQLTLADGLAAVMGTRYGRGNTYRILGNKKSVMGTATFLLVSLVLLVGYSVITGDGPPLGILLAAALATTAIENVASYGLDNLAVPLFIGWVLTTL